MNDSRNYIQTPRKVQYTYRQCVAIEQLTQLQKLGCLLCLSITIGLAHALQDIQIIGGVNAANPKIAIVDFTGDKPNQESNIAHIIATDLAITGEFTVKQYPNTTSIESSVKYIITGSATDGNINFALMGRNVAPQTNTSLNLKYTHDIRKAAHTISNTAYQKITHTHGIFTTKIAYIVQKGSAYTVYVSDYDGYNQQNVFSSNYPVTSLDWDSIGNLLSYASFELGKAVVYVQDLRQGKRDIVANFDGSNSSPAFAPGGKLAVTLSKDYGSHIYLVNNASFHKTSTAASLINFGTIDTEASFASNGNMLFTSDHDGSPQIFMSNIHNSKPIRLTTNLGKYNTTARFSHDASKITFISHKDSALRVYIMDLVSKAAYPISLSTALDMAPNFAPNDKLVLFSSNKDSIYIANTTGTIQTRLNKISGNGTVIDQRWANNY